MLFECDPEGARRQAGSSLSTFPDNPQSTPELAPPPPADWNAGSPVQPAWNGWDILRIVLMGFVSLAGTIMVLLILVPGSLRQRGNYLSARPEFTILAQMVAYLFLLAYMYILVTKERGQPAFWRAMRWNWPARAWLYVMIGVLLQAVFLMIESTRLLPFPKDVPFESLLKRPFSLMLIAFFAVTLGPLLEELFFRGFLYPVLRYSFGVAAAVIATSLPFGLMHAAQYGYSWASVLLIFVVGVVLALVREKQDSLAASFLVHGGYNGTIVMLMFAATDGFRHLDKLNK